MDNVATAASLFKIADFTCLRPFLWDEDAINSRKPRLYTCIVASIIHAIFWLQLLFCSSVRQKSMQWIYAYLITDLCLVFRFFFIYIVRTTSFECEPTRSWQLFMCYFEATVDNYFNVIEVYILLALNICRYIQIAYKRNVYRVYKKTLIFVHLGIYLFTLLFSLVQFLLGWTRVNEYVNDRCETSYTNTYIQVINTIVRFALPILLNIFVIYASVRCIHLASGLQRAHHHVSAREKYHRALVIQFIIFYTIWLALWSPNIIVYQLSVNSSNLTAIVRSLNFIEIALDPIIIAALDVRFWQAWKQVWRSIRNKIFVIMVQQGRIRPASTNTNAFSIRSPRIRTTPV